MPLACNLANPRTLPAMCLGLKVGTNHRVPRKAQATRRAPCWKHWSSRSKAEAPPPTTSTSRPVSRPGSRKVLEWNSRTVLPVRAHAGMTGVLCAPVAATRCRACTSPAGVVSVQPAPSWRARCTGVFSRMPSARPKR